MHNAFRHFPVLILHQVNISILTETAKTTDRSSTTIDQGTTDPVQYNHQQRNN